MSYSPPRRFTDASVKVADPEARHAQEELINAYEAEEERIMNVLSKKLQKLKEDKIELENVLEAESENHVNKLSRQLGSMRMEHEELKGKYEALLAESERVADGRGEGSSSSADPSSSNSLGERKHRRRKVPFVSGGEKRKKRISGKSKDTASSNSTSTSNGKVTSKGKEKARSSSRSPPPRPQAMSRSSTLTAINTFLGGGLSATEPSADMMLTVMKRENENLRNRLVDTEREYMRVSRLNEIYREELISHRRRLGLSADNLIDLSADPISQPTHQRSHPSYYSNMSSPSASMYHIPSMNVNGSRQYDLQGLGHVNNVSNNGHHQAGSGTTGNTRHHHHNASSSKAQSSSSAVQGVPIPRPVVEDPYALGHTTTRRIRPKNVISSEGSTPLSRSPNSDGVDSNIDDLDSQGDDIDDEDDDDLFSPGASGSASGAGSISPYPLFSPMNPSHMHNGYHGRRMRSASSASAGGGEYYHAGYGSNGQHQNQGHYNNQEASGSGGGGYNNTGGQPASYASVDTSATSPPSSGGGMGFAGGAGGVGFAGLMGMRGIGIPSLGAMAVNATGYGSGRGSGRGRRGGGNATTSTTTSRGGLSYPSVPPPSLSSSLGSVSPSVPLYMHHRDRDGREWDASREPSLSPVEPLSRRNSIGGRRGSVGGGARVAETGSLRSANMNMNNSNSRRASFDYSGGASGSGGAMLGIPIAGSLSMSMNGNASGSGGVSGPGTNVILPSGARVAETGSLLRSNGGSVNVGVGGGRSRAESLTLSSSAGGVGMVSGAGAGGYTAGYGYYLPETVDEGE